MQVKFIEKLLKHGYDFYFAQLCQSDLDAAEGRVQLSDLQGNRMASRPATVPVNTCLLSLPWSGCTG
eukprot:941699-Amphidinium_carterae.1